MLDSFGNQPPTQQHAFVIQESIYSKGQKMRDILDQVFGGLNLNEVFSKTGYRMIDEVYSCGKSLQGTDLIHICLAIAYRIALDNDLHFDTEIVQKTYGERIMGRLHKLINMYLPKPPSRNEPMSGRKATFQKYVLKMARELDFDKPVMTAVLVEQLSVLPKSTKVKASVALYIMDPKKITVISKMFKKSKSSIRESLKAIEDLINVDYGLLKRNNIKTATKGKAATVLMAKN